MGRYLSIVLYCFFSSSLFAQFGSQQIISIGNDTPKFIAPIDLDIDGKMDLLAYFPQEQYLGWYRSVDGQGAFEGPLVIQENFLIAKFLDPIDLDGDSDKDILFISEYPWIGWLENLDGQGTFGPPTTIYSNSDYYLKDAVLADLDQDNDLDIIAILEDAPNVYDRITMFLNSGNGTFGPGELIINNRTYVWLESVDIDEDGKLDLLTSHNGLFFEPAILAWYQNQGDAVFGPENVIYQYQFVASDWTHIYYLKYVDLNGDNHGDILVNTQHDDFGSYARWFRNLNQNGTFEADGGTLTRLRPYRFHDIDDDGDLDIVSYRGGNQDFISWIENDSDGNFLTERIITTEIDGPSDVRIADINNDGFADIVSASTDDMKLAWYPFTGLGIETESIVQITVFPNPTDGLITIHGIQSSILKASLISMHGTATNLPISEKSLDLSTFPPGIYLLVLETIDGTISTHKIAITR